MKAANDELTQRGAELLDGLVVNGSAVSGYRLAYRSG